MGHRVNHATVSRADLRGRAIGGRDEIVRDMTGQKMIVRRMSEADMEAAPFAPWQDPADRPVPLPPEPPPPVTGTSYTYGVPEDMARRLSAEEQVMAQPHTEASSRGLRAVAGTVLTGRSGALS